MVSGIKYYKRLLAFWLFFVKKSNGTTSVTGVLSEHWQHCEGVSVLEPSLIPHFAVSYIISKMSKEPDQELKKVSGSRLAKGRIRILRRECYNNTEDEGWKSLLGKCAQELHPYPF